MRISTDFKIFIQEEKTSYKLKGWRVNQNLNANNKAKVRGFYFNNNLAFVLRSDNIILFFKNKHITNRKLVNRLKEYIDNITILKGRIYIDGEKVHYGLHTCFKKKA